MSLANMNKLQFVPVKDYDANRLKAGVLQLPNRCQLVLDETALQPGQLDVEGNRSASLISTIHALIFLQGQTKYIPL